MAITKRKKQIIIIAVILAVIIGGAVAFSHSGSDYITVSQFQAKVQSMQGKQVSISGKVAPGSSNWDDKTKTMKFDLFEGNARVTVIYQGFIPENFKPGAELVVRGKYTDGVVQAAAFGKTRSLCAICH